MKLRNILLAAFVAGTSASAMAANPLTSSQLLRAIQVSVADYSNVEPDMSKSISGLRSVTSGNNALVTIDMNSDGMKMSAKYLCVAQAQDMACRIQQ
jgi:hypothetical protein